MDNLPKMGEDVINKAISVAPSDPDLRDGKTNSGGNQNADLQDH
jgi:hypothetical protein